MYRKTTVYFLILLIISSTIGFKPTNVKVQAEEPVRIEKKPVWSPEGNRIAFESISFDDYTASYGNPLDEYNFDIWVMMADGTNPVNLTAQNLKYDSYPAWSPDGKYIAFLSKRSDTVDVWVMESNGTNSVNITTNTPGDDLAPTWSPDGRLIAYIAENKKGVSYDVWVVEPDGSNPVKLTTGENHIYGSVTWSPDSRSVAYTNAAIDYGSTDSVETEQFNPLGVWKTTVNGQLTSMLTPSRRDIDVNWSPQGDFLVTTVIEDLNSSMWLVSSDGATLINLASVTPNLAQFPVWSPSGDFISFISQRDDVINSRDIWVMNADGSNASNLTLDFGFVNYEPSWSPDEEKIAFTSNAPRDTSLGFDLNSDIWIMNSDGSCKINLTGP
jgi:TolB protein